MSTNHARIAPPHSVVLIMDPATGEIPETMGGQLVAATSSCIAVGCLSEADGLTDLYLGKGEILASHSLAHEGWIETPNRRLALCSVQFEEFASMVTEQTRTPIQVWVNDPVEPDDIRVVAG